MQDVTHQLVIRNYSGLVADGRAGVSSADELEEAITSYQDAVIENKGLDPEDYALIDMPPEAFKRSDAYPLDADEWRVNVDLWWSDGKPGDLTLEAYMRATPDGIHVEIEEIHVL